MVAKPGGNEANPGLECSSQRLVDDPFSGASSIGTERTEQMVSGADRRGDDDRHFGG